MAKLSHDHVLKLAKLSRLSLSDDEVALYQKELSAILAYVEQLDSVDTKGLEPTHQVSGLESVMREDVVKPQQASPKELMKRVPSTKDSYIKVGRMI